MDPFASFTIQFSRRQDIILWHTICDSLLARLAASSVSEWPTHTCTRYDVSEHIPKEYDELTSALPYVCTLNHGRSGGGLPKADFSHDCVFLDDGPALHAKSVAGSGVILDDRSSAVVAGCLVHKRGKQRQKKPRQLTIVEQTSGCAYLADMMLISDGYFWTSCDNLTKKNEVYD